MRKKEDVIISSYYTNRNSNIRKVSVDFNNITNENVILNNCFSIDKIVYSDDKIFWIENIENLDQSIAKEKEGELDLGKRPWLA